MKTKLKLLLYKICRMFPIKNNRILLFSYYGANYGGSPKYLGEYFAKEAPDLEIIWAFTDVEKHREAKASKLVKYSSFQYYYYLATSHFIITNYRMTLEFCKRKKQKYIQTWHSSLRLKQIEKDAEETLPVHYVEMAKHDSKQIDILLAGSKKSKEIYQRSFWYTGEYLDCGTPQCDLFFRDNENYRNKICQYFQISKEKKILLYAPTFRKDHDLSVYDIDYERLRVTLNGKFGGDWVILLRLHPHLINLVDNLEFNEYLLDATKYDDIQELLQVSDIVITDYSALMFDYLLTRKPCFLYTNDYEKYVSADRKLYFDLKELPFPISFSNAELIGQIQSFSLKEYQERCEKFIDKEIGTWDTGMACKKVLEYIKEELHYEKV